MPPLADVDAVVGAGDEAGAGAGAGEPLKLMLELGDNASRDSLAVEKGADAGEWPWSSSLPSGSSRSVGLAVATAEAVELAESAARNGGIASPSVPSGFAAVVVAVRTTGAGRSRAFASSASMSCAAFEDALATAAAAMGGARRMVCQDRTVRQHASAVPSELQHQGSLASPRLASPRLASPHICRSLEARFDVI